MIDVTGRRVLVVGLGVSGHAAAKALADLGAVVAVTEGGSGPLLDARANELRARGVEVQLGGHHLARLDADMAVVSPGIPPAAAVVKELAARGVEIIGEVELAWRVARCDFLAVTGTNGKTTTTSLLAAMLDESGIRSVAAGNIGHPLIEAARAVPVTGAIVVEVSSFQLACTVRFKPRVAVVLNIAEDHTDWHGSFASYVAAKARITSNQGPDDILVANGEDEHAAAIAGNSQARVVPFSGDRAIANGTGWRGTALVHKGSAILDASTVQLAGHAGREDVAAAACAALEYGVSAASVASAVKSFRPIPHRLQTVARIDGVDYVDDSKATNPHAALAAVRGLSDVVLIAGGRSKGIDLAPLAATVPPVRAVVALGESAAEIERVFRDHVPVERVADMAAAVTRASEVANGRGSVLLSPGCASLDMYASYAARGADFAHAVAALRVRAGSDANDDVGAPVDVQKGVR